MSTKTYDQIPQTYEQWRYCITVECGIELTASFVARRLAALRSAGSEDTRRFRLLYGDGHWKSVLAWFELAEREMLSAG